MMIQHEKINNLYRFMNAVACLARFLNAIFGLRIEHVTRIMINAVLMLVSYMLLAMAVLKY